MAKHHGSIMVCPHLNRSWWQPSLFLAKIKKCKQSVVHGMREVVTGGRTAGGKRRARSASTAARSKSSGQGFAALTGRSSPYRVGRRQLRRTGSGGAYAIP